MTKKILFLIAVLITSYSFSQENTASPYSFYGIGISKFRGTNDITQMGGISVYADSTHINILNPASYSNQLLTSFNLGGTTNFYTLKSGSATEKAQKTTFDYLTIGLPVSKKLGLALGVLPETAVGYRFINNQTSTNNTVSRYRGQGGVNKVFAGAGYKITDKLSLGLDFQYLFGSIDTESILFENGLQFGSREINESNISGAALNFGATYQTKIYKKYNLFSSLTYSPEAKLTSTNTRNTSTVAATSTGGFTTVDNEIVIVPNSKLTIPSKISFGAGIGNRKWFVGGDLTLKGASNNLNRFDAYPNVKFESASKIAIGGFYIPKFDSYNNYFNRITYRAGLKLENTGLVINKNTINDNSFNLGVGLPLSGTFSTINIGLEYGIKGTTNNNLIKENYFSVNVGLLFNDKWFRKTLYN